jgi:hypothetical protein
VSELRSQCGKLQVLDRLLTSLRSQGHKVVLFSQMARMLDLLDYYLSEQDIQCRKFDGSTAWADRQKYITGEGRGRAVPAFFFFSFFLFPALFVLLFPFNLILIVAISDQPSSFFDDKYAILYPQSSTRTPRCPCSC